MKSSCIIKPAMNLETILYICYPFRTTRILWQEIRALLTERNLPLPNDISLCRDLDLATILLSSCRFLLCCVYAFIRVHTFQSKSSSGTVLAMCSFFLLFLCSCLKAVGIPEAKGQVTQASQSVRSCPTCLPCNLSKSS